MLTFSPMRDTSHSGTLVLMMQGLYDADPASHPVLPSHFPKTISRLLSRPESGTILLFLDADTPIGYALLIPYWSNEFGGNLLFIDELFVSPSRRGQGIAKAFFIHLEQNPPPDTVALALEVTPNNLKAKELYHSLGFEKRKNDLLIQRLK